MNIKRCLKKVHLLYQLNSLFKARQQERQVSEELNYYRNKAARKGIVVPGSGALADALMQCLIARGVSIIPRGKGDLHIFLTYSLNNWESVLPLALAPFGRVTTFEWRSRGFDDRETNWVKRCEAMNIEMLEIFRKAHAEQPVDAVIGYLSGYNVNPETLRKMANKGAVIFNFSWDDKLGFRGKRCGKRYSSRWTGPAALASVVDLNLTNSPESCIKYMVEGGLAMFWPEAAQPDIHKPYDLPFEYNVSFVGGKYGWRAKFIARLQKMGIKVVCFGNGWGNGPLSNEEMVKLYSRSRINLGFAGVGYSKKLMCLKGRDFEVPMSEGLYLTQDNPELSLVYKIGKEIVTYKDENDCIQKIRWLLENPDEAEKIKKAGRERALKDNTWDQRFSKIFKVTGLLKDD